jgi:hypothetical protein
LVSGPPPRRCQHGAIAANLFDVPRELVSDRYEILRHGVGGARTTVICGVVRFDHPAAHHTRCRRLSGCGSTPRAAVASCREKWSRQKLMMASGRSRIPW